ncbi:MAG: hypothetical protein RL885_33340 [Planctomycetota bacterium]
MPIAELGYRAWEGDRRGWLARSLTISRYGIRVTQQNSKLLRRLLWLAWVPLVYFAPVFFAIGWVANPENDLANAGWLGMIGVELLGEEMVEAVRARPEVLLPPIWSTAFVLFFAWIQSWLAMLVVTIVGPRLISWDLRGKAFLLYFSKPISFWQYLVGKLGIIQYFVLRISLFPALVLYAISILLAPNLTTLAKTAPIMLQIVIASLLVTIPVSVVMLVLSSLSKDARFATFGWIFIWIFGEVTYGALSFAPDMGNGASAVPQWAFLTSIRETAIVATSSAFDLTDRLANMMSFLRDLGVQEQFFRNLSDVGGAVGNNIDLAQSSVTTGTAVSNPQTPWALGYLAAVTIIATIVLRRRVQKPVSI